MPIYEYFCRTCNHKYEARRRMAEADAPLDCPECHEQNSVRTLSMVVMHVGGRSSESASSASTPAQACGGCCGGACGCGHSHGMN
jgi:putative FmdB family regulatory protein